MRIGQTIEELAEKYNRDTLKEDRERTLIFQEYIFYFVLAGILAVSAIESTKYSKAREDGFSNFNNYQELYDKNIPDSGLAKSLIDENP